MMQGKGNANIYTTLEEVDTFAHAIEELARNGAAPATQA